MELAEITRLIEEGKVEYVKIGAADIEGVYRGKRVAATHFLNSLEDGFAQCDVLFGWDIGEVVLPNLKFSNWERGFADIVMKPDLGTFAIEPWEDHVASAICDLWSEHGERVTISPRYVLQRVVERARALGFEPLAAAELEFRFFRENMVSLRDKDFGPNLTPLEPGVQLLLDQPIERRRAPAGAYRTHDARPRHRNRRLQPRAWTRHVRNEHPLRRRRHRGRLYHALQERRQRDLPPDGVDRIVHGQVERPGRRQQRALASEPVGPQPGAQRILGRRSRRAYVADHAAVSGRSVRETARMHGVVRTGNQLVQALRRRDMGAAQHHLGYGQPHVLGTYHQRQPQRHPHREPGSGSRRQLLPGVCRHPGQWVVWHRARVRVATAFGWQRL